MPRGITAVQAELRAKLAEVKTLKAGQHAIEAPIRESRRTLTKRLGSAKVTVERWNLKLSDLLFDKAYGSFVYPPKLEEAEVHLRQAIANFRSHLSDLQTFDALHRIDGAVYPHLPELDREATVAAAKQERARMDAECRARVEAWKRGGSRRTPSPQASRADDHRQLLEDLSPDLRR